MASLTRWTKSSGCPIHTPNPDDNRTEARCSPAGRVSSLTAGSETRVTQRASSASNRRSEPAVQPGMPGSRRSSTPCLRDGKTLTNSAYGWTVRLMRPTSTVRDGDVRFASSPADPAPAQPSPPARRAPKAREGDEATRPASWHAFPWAATNGLADASFGVKPVSYGWVVTTGLLVGHKLIEIRRTGAGYTARAATGPSIEEEPAFAAFQVRHKVGKALERLSESGPIDPDSLEDEERVDAFIDAVDRVRARLVRAKAAGWAKTRTRSSVPPSAHKVSGGLPSLGNAAKSAVGRATSATAIRNWSRERRLRVCLTSGSSIRASPVWRRSAPVAALGGCLGAGTSAVLGRPTGSAPADVPNALRAWDGRSTEDILFVSPARHRPPLAADESSNRSKNLTTWYPSLVVRVDLPPSALAGQRSSLSASRRSISLARSVSNPFSQLAHR